MFQLIQVESKGLFLNEFLLLLMKNAKKYNLKYNYILSTWVSIVYPGHPGHLD